MTLLADIQTKAQKSLEDKAADTVRQVEHLAKEARELKTRAVHEFEDLRDAASLRVRRAPLATAAMAFGAGVLIGAVCVWATVGCSRREA